MRCRTLRVAELQRGKAFAVQRHIDVGRIGIEALPDHEHGLAMRIAALLGKCDVCRQRNISADLLPGKLEGIGCEPHVFATAGQCVYVVRGIILRRPGVQHRPNIGVVLEQPEGRRGGLRAEQTGRNKKEEENDTAE